MAGSPLTIPFSDVFVNFLESSRIYNPFQVLNNSLVSLSHTNINLPRKGWKLITGGLEVFRQLGPPNISTNISPCTEGLEILQREEAKKWLQYFQRRCNISHAVAIFPIWKNTGIRVFISYNFITITLIRADWKQKFKAQISHNLGVVLECYFDKRFLILRKVLYWEKYSQIFHIRPIPS